ncbi:MAG: diaminopropionate ammonia-lyase [Parasphingorhabdus sp.]|jgi:diaminopropionate ammonia-lyase
MLEQFRNASIGHQAATPLNNDCYETVISRADFARSWQEITQWPGYTATPLHELQGLAEKLQINNIFYKDEGPRFGLGSFKALGGAYAAICLVQRELERQFSIQASSQQIREGRYIEQVAAITLVSATDGNHGRSLAWGARMIGAPCRIYIHKEVSEGREKAMQELGAHVIRIEGDYDESVEQARVDAESNDWFVVSDTSWEGYTQPPTDVMAGYGVMVRESVEALQQPPSHVFLQGGVGGLAAGVAAALHQAYGDQKPRMIVVEPELAACLFVSAGSGQPTDVTIEQESIMAGLSCGAPSALAWSVLQSECTDFLTIPDALIPPIMRTLARPDNNDPAIEAGESAVAGLAALMATAIQPVLRDQLGLTEQSTVLIIGSEGATDADIYARVMAGKI